LQEGPFTKKKVLGCPQIDKFSTYNIHAVHKGSVSPRIGILGASTYPSETEFADGMQCASGQSLTNVRIDDVSASVNSQIKGLED
jgi:hypothetical protein